MEDEDERSIELSSVAAIFPELILDNSRPYTGNIGIAVAPEKPLKIYFHSSTEVAPPTVLTPPTSIDTISDDPTQIPPPLSTKTVNNDVHSITHLPPLDLKITLPDGYPTATPPEITITVRPQWLPQKVLKAVSAKCTELWEEYGREQVVFTYIDWVQQNAEQAFGVAENADRSLCLSADFKLILLDYDLKRKREQFENETFDCGICLEPKKGKKCHRMLLCGHVFCVSCLQDFYNNCINEGDVDNVKCMDPGCSKNLEREVSPGKKRKLDPSLNPSELLQIPIGQELVQRYVRLKRKKKLESDKTTVYCPRQWCQGAAKSKKHPKANDPFANLDEEEDEPEKRKPIKDRDSEDIPMSERLSVCEDCNFAFCSVCKKGWHGELARCNPRRQAELNEEEKASLEYLQRFSTACPTCNAPAQKTHGCNHMICFKCKTHFCYLCSSYLMEDNPYRHFNDFKSPCYMRLWELEAGDGADAGLGFRGGERVVDEWEIPSDSDDETDEFEEEEEVVGNNANPAHQNPPQDWEVEEEDSEDEEPAPDQRRANRPVIEIVNFAQNGANQRIELPHQPQRAVAAPPPVPAAPRRRGQGQRARHQQRRQNEPQHRQRVALNPGDFLVPARPVIAAPGQGNNAEQALQRFLRLALEDRENEWDSDDDD